MGLCSLRLLCWSFWHCRGYHECVCCRCLYDVFYYLSLVEAWERRWEACPLEEITKPEAACHYYKHRKGDHDFLPSRHVLAVRILEFELREDSNICKGLAKRIYSWLMAFSS